MSWGADTIVHTREIGHVRLVGLVKADPIPAGLHVDLSAQTISAVCIGKAWGRGFRAVVEASIRHLYLFVSIRVEIV